MSRLFIDDFVKNQGFDSTVGYIRWCLENAIPPLFGNVNYFESLYSRGLIEEGFSIRTSNQGIVDQHYEVDANGNLVGIIGGPHSGEEGVFRPEEILSGERISSGWTIESVPRFSRLFEKWVDEGESSE